LGARTPIFPDATPGSKEPSGRREVALRIFVVDDDADLRHFVEAWIASRTGHEVHTFASGAEAVEALALADYSPAVILTDLDMPGPPGEELARAAARLQDPPRIVLMSGDPKRLERARNLAHQTLHKPFEIEELMSALIATAELRNC
jgi:CheY-like chemotaxis protein